MKILHLSDTHGCHLQLKDLPEADVLVHSGDFTMLGSQTEAIDFLNWFCDLPYRHKLFICGNHDVCMYQSNIVGLDSNVHYLCNSGVEIEGVRFYGIPLFIADRFANRQNSNYAHIPVDTDVLITHCPPYGILDFDGGIHYGSVSLLDRVVVVNPKLHLFGHIHSQRGLIEINGTHFSNGAVMNNNYEQLHTGYHLLQVGV